MADFIITTLVLVSLVVFFFGLFLCWFASGDEDTTTRWKVRTMVAVIVTLGWISATVAGILITSYTVSPLLHALMGAIVGYFFTEEGFTFNIGGNK